MICCVKRYAGLDAPLTGSSSVYVLVLRNALPVPILIALFMYVQQDCSVSKELGWAPVLVRD